MLGLLAALALAAFWLYREATAIPDFYAQAMAMPQTAEPPKVAADRVERNVLTVQNRLERAEPWQLVLKDMDINAWLATELAAKLPMALPGDIEDPRVVLREGTVNIACKHRQAMGGVLSIVLAPSLSNKPNELAIHVQSFSLGRLPLPQKQYQEQISKAAADARLNLRWEEHDGTAVAIVDLPSQFEDLPNRDIELTSIEVTAGEIVLQGTAKRREK